MKILLLIVCLAWQAPIYAENGLPPWEQIASDVQSETSMAVDNSADPFDIVSPPLPEDMKARIRAPSKEHLITEFSSSIRPGANLPDNVYKCVLDHIDGIGSDLAAQLVWLSCLRLNLK